MGHLRPRPGPEYGVGGGGGGGTDSKFRVFFLECQLREMLLFGELIGCCTGNDRGELSSQNGRIYQNPLLSKNNSHPLPQKPESLRKARFNVATHLNAQESLQADLDSIAYGSHIPSNVDRNKIQIASFDQLDSLQLGVEAESQQFENQLSASQIYKKRAYPVLTAKRIPELKSNKSQPSVKMDYSAEGKENLTSKREVLSWHDSRESALSYWQQPDQTHTQAPRPLFPAKSPRIHLPRGDALSEISLYRLLAVFTEIEYHH